jgi:hypothetical protein
MRVVRLHIVLAKGKWERPLRADYLKTLLDDGTVVYLDVLTPDDDTLFDFYITYVQPDEDYDENVAENIYYALEQRFQPEYESMVDVEVAH